MKPILIFLACIAFSFTAFSQNYDCLQAMKTGTFFYPDKKYAATIIRKKKKHTEIYNDGKSKLIFKIEWPNDSTYVLTLKKKVHAPGPLNKGDWIKATITECDGTTYYCETTSSTGKTWDGYIQKEN